MATQKTRIITIAGRPGSGKSTASHAIAQQLGYEHFSSGDLFRAIGKERGIDVTETNRAAAKDAEIDRLVDERLAQIGQTQEQVAIDSRLAWHWIPQSFKVYLDLDLKVAAQRILRNLDAKRMEHEHIPDDPSVYAEHLQQRLDLEADRYLAKYGVDPYDKSNYDLVVNTEVNDPAQVVALIVDAYNEWLRSER
jgi:CMP/dCMP kinase